MKKEESYYKQNVKSINRKACCYRIISGKTKSVNYNTFKKYEPWTEEQLLIISPFIKNMNNKLLTSAHTPFKATLFNDKEIQEAEEWLRLFSTNSEHHATK